MLRLIILPLSYSFPCSCCLFKVVWSKAPCAPEKFNFPLCFHREKKISRSSALKVLDHAMIGPEGTDNCHKFVDILGLRTIFPLFMKSPKKIKKVGTTEKEHEGRLASRSFLLSWEGRLASMEEVNGEKCLKSTCKEEGIAHHQSFQGSSCSFQVQAPCCRLAVDDTLALLVLVSAVPGDSISCAVNKLFYSCRVCCLKL